MDIKLENWRKQIDIVDEKLLILLAKRMDIVRKIGKFKKEHQISLFDEKRWEKVEERNLIKAQTLRLSKYFVKNLLNLIHKYSINLQKEI